MERLYHGTTSRMAIEIARAGAILSPWDLVIISPWHPQRKQQLIAGHPDKTWEQICLEIATRSYSEREIEHRVKCVSLTKKFEIAFGYTDGDGVVLGCEITPVVAKTLPSDWEIKNTIYVPRKLGLETLKDVYLTEEAVDCRKESICGEFDKYSPRYFVAFKDGEKLRIK